MLVCILPTFLSPPFSHIVNIEWTAQHGCGTDKTNCDIILQYMVREGRKGEDKREGGIKRGTNICISATLPGSQERDRA